MDANVTEWVAQGMAAGVLERSRETVVARAPGRLDVMGGIADYSGSLVLQMPIREATWVAAQTGDERTVRVVSDERIAELPLDPLATADYPTVQAFFRGRADDAWAAYVAGVVTVLARERGVAFDRGLRIVVRSEVPEGKGVSSSAAVEVATMQAVAALRGVTLAPVELATLCQMVENRIVGAPCGIMDQTASACGEEAKLLALRCQPADILGHVALPADLGVWGIDSGIRHAVSGADYGTVRAAAFMGFRILRSRASAAEATHWGGYLANITPSELARHEDALPEGMRGDAFLERFGDHGDAVTTIDSQRTYPVRRATRHPVDEHHRIRAFSKLLASPPDDESRRLLGEMMFQSHASYSACGLGSEGTDRLVEMVREAGPDQGLYGAKITGGGSGGTVAVLGNADAGPVVHAIAERYAQAAGRGGYVFEGSSAGACAWGVRHLGGE